MYLSETQFKPRFWIQKFPGHLNHHSSGQYLKYVAGAGVVGKFWDANHSLLESYPRAIMSFQSTTASATRLRTSLLTLFSWSIIRLIGPDIYSVISYIGVRRGLVGENRPHLVSRSKFQLNAFICRVDLNRDYCCKCFRLLYFKGWKAVRSTCSWCCETEEWRNAIFFAHSEKVTRCYTTRMSIDSSAPITSSLSVCIEAKVPRLTKYLLNRLRIQSNILDKLPRGLSPQPIFRIERKQYEFEPAGGLWI